jgi:hypothetical protein
MHSLLRLELEDLNDLLYTLDLLKSCCCSGLSWTIVSLTRFPMDMIFEYTAVSVRLWIYLCALIYTKSHLLVLFISIGLTKYATLQYFLYTSCSSKDRNSEANRKRRERRPADRICCLFRGTQQTRTAMLCTPPRRPAA